MPAIKVRVVVPVYNTGTQIDVCVRSILAQSMGPAEYEALLVDDGSTDGTTARLEAYAAEYRQVKVLQAGGSGGPGRPRNLGIEQASGEYVYFLDHDDWLAPQALQRLYTMAIRNQADIVIGKVMGTAGRFRCRCSASRAIARTTSPMTC